LTGHGSSSNLRVIFVPHEKGNERSDAMPASVSRKVLEHLDLGRDFIHVTLVWDRDGGAELDIPGFDYIWGPVQIGAPEYPNGEWVASGALKAREFEVVRRIPSMREILAISLRSAAAVDTQTV